MSIVDSLRILTERRADVIIVASDGDLRLIALTWDDHEKSRGVERTVETNADDCVLQRALDELVEELL